MRYNDADLDSWVREGIVSADQADAIRRRHSARESSERRGRLVSALAVIGAVVGGLGVILFFAANWDAIPRPTRVALLLATMIGAYAGGYVLGPRRPAVGKALLLLGAIGFGANLFLVGQMYHVEAHDPLAFLVWTAAVVPMALVARTRPLAALGILTFGAWIVYELVDAGDGEELIEYVPVVGAFYGSALYAWGTWLRDEIFSGVMRGFGFILAALGGFVFTFSEVIEELDEEGTALGTVAWLAIAGPVVAAFAGSAFLAMRRSRRTAPFEASAVAALAALLLAAVLLPEHADAIVYPILFNLLVAAVALGAIAVGYLNDEAWLVNSGIALVAVDVFARYVDFFWDLLPRALGFLGAGLLLLALALALERQRARLVRSAEART
jgi:uncharacterized membrane protein